MGPLFDSGAVCSMGPALYMWLWSRFSLSTTIIIYVGFYYKALSLHSIYIYVYTHELSEQTKMMLLLVADRAPY